MPAAPRGASSSTVEIDRIKADLAKAVSESAAREVEMQRLKAQLVAAECAAAEAAQEAASAGILCAELRVAEEKGMAAQLSSQVATLAAAQQQVEHADEVAQLKRALAEAADTSSQTTEAAKAIEHRGSGLTESRSDERLLDTNTRSLCREATQVNAMRKCNQARKPRARDLATKSPSRPQSHEQVYRPQYRQLAALQAGNCTYARN